MKLDDIEALKMIVHSRSGMVVDPSKTYSIETRLGPLARREGFSSIGELITAVRTRRDDRLMWAVTEAMASTETSFFRDETPFNQFRDEMLPKLTAQRGGAPIKVWSAACASGQEAYSLAMVVEEERAKLAGTQVELFASDLSEICIEKSQAGLYTQFEIQRGLPIRFLLRYFEKAGEMWRVQPSLRQAVRWKRINLLADLTPLGRFDVIFCRYAIGQFDEPTRRRVLGQLALALPEDGYLVLGLTETAAGSDALRPVPGQPGLYMRNPAYRAAAA